MIMISDKRNCCGCTACEAICPQNAITMKADVLGFKYPTVNTDLCINCGLCDKVCVFTKNKCTEASHPDFPIVYGARHKDINHVMSSQSGAAFIAISDHILNKGGIIYGVGYGEHFTAQHKRATTKEERDEFKGSKYVQSNLNGIFIQVKEDLKNNNLVLVSGTPCQISGLKSFIGEKLSINLICIDLICHGVPSPKVWDDYLSYLEKKYNSNILTVNFRDKIACGWKSHKESFIFQNKPKKIIRSTYSNLFYEHIMLRPSCSICRYTTVFRDSDFTIGDFWTYKKVDPNFFSDNKGCSLLFINNDKAKHLFKYIKQDFWLLSTSSPDHYLQPNLIRPSLFSPHWKEFEKKYQINGIKYVLQRDKKNKLIHVTKKLAQCILHPIRTLYNIINKFKYYISK